MSAPLHSPVPGIADLGDAIAAYALGGNAALDAVEARALEAHLPTCADCRAELVELQRTVAGIGLNAIAEEPPARLRASVLDSARAHPSTGSTRAPAHPRTGETIPRVREAARE